MLRLICLVSWSENKIEKGQCTGFVGDTTMLLALNWSQCPALRSTLLNRCPVQSHKDETSTFLLQRLGGLMDWNLLLGVAEQFFLFFLQFLFSAKELELRDFTLVSPRLPFCQTVMGFKWGGECGLFFQLLWMCFYVADGFPKRKESKEQTQRRISFYSLSKLLLILPL